MTTQTAGLDLTDKSSKTLHQALQSIYRSIVHQERVDYEKLHGEQSEEDFIQVLAHSDSLKWLDALTRLIVLLDLFDDADEFSPNASRVIARKVKGMVSKEGSADTTFSTHYQRHVDSSEQLRASHDALASVLERFS